MPPSNEVSRFAHWSDPSRNSISSLCGEASEWAVSCTGRCPEMRIDVLIHRHWYMAVYGSSERPTKRKELAMNEEIVPAGSECPKCGENRTDRLWWDEEGVHVTCECGCVYEPDRPRSSQDNGEEQGP